MSWGNDFFSSMSINRKYLGISQEEIKDVYQSFDEMI